jgi:hypothetical protein
VEQTGCTLDFPLNHWSMDLKSLRFSFFIVVYDSENLTLLTKPYLKGFTTSASLFSFYFEHAGSQILMLLHHITRDSLVIFFQQLYWNVSHVSLASTKVLRTYFPFILQEYVLLS